LPLDILAALAVPAVLAVLAVLAVPAVLAVLAVIAVPTVPAVPAVLTVPAFLMSEGEDAELLVYLVDEEKDIYIGVLVALFATLLAGRSPAESLNCLGVAESLRTGK
jgi:hypothetical protein